MKQYTHAWIALKAVERLEGFRGRFNDTRNGRLDGFLDFISTYPNTFVRGAWFPDSIIRDNLQGGHTWKYRLDAQQGRVEKRRPPSHNRCRAHVDSQLGQPVSLNLGQSDLADRCEALGQTIRDSMLITNQLAEGDVLALNHSQISLFFLMLAHYAADAHVPVHCDERLVASSSRARIHGDLEGMWESEVLKFYSVSKKRGRFDLDQNDRLQRRSGVAGYNQSLLGRCEALLKQSAWDNMDKTTTDWQAFLGRGNRNFWDYLVGTCLVSFHMSLLMFPPGLSGVNYATVRLSQNPQLLTAAQDHLPAMLADAIDTVALLWLAAWERWERMARGSR